VKSLGKKNSGHVAFNVHYRAFHLDLRVGGSRHLKDNILLMFTDFQSLK
jgi:hypothetical protein